MTRNVRHGDKPFAVQARTALDSLEAAANAAGLSLKEFDAIYPCSSRATPDGAVGRYWRTMT